MQTHMAELGNGTNGTSQAYSMHDFFNTSAGHSLIVTCVVLAFIMVAKAIVMCCPCTSIVNDPAMKEPAYILFREVVIMLITVLIIEALHFYDVLGFLNFSVAGLCYTILTASMCWALLGMLYILSAQ